MIRESAKGAESAKQKNALAKVAILAISPKLSISPCKKNDMAKLTKLANFRQNFVKIAKIVMQIFIQTAKSEEDILSLSKITKNGSKNY